MLPKASLERPPLLLTAPITIIFVLFQVTFVHIGMSVAASSGLGYNDVCTVVVALGYISTTLPSQYRLWTLGLVNACYYFSQQSDSRAFCN